MTLDQVVETVQLTYPQVYYVCHTRHQRKRSTEHRLSARDAAILAHCSAETPIIPARLARHLSIARSTLSEAIKKLDRGGYVRRVAAIQGDKRLSGILLTSQGLRAVRETSVLESDRLAEVLAATSAADRASISRGLTKLAEACRRYSERPRSRQGDEES
jgi:DNA-binding MarR family transcriptional regulator